MSRVTSIRLDEELAARLDELAAALDRSRAWLIEQAIVRYLDEEAWQVAAIGEALADYRAGTAELVPHEDVVKHLDAMLEAKLGNAQSQGA